MTKELTDELLEKLALVEGGWWRTIDGDRIIVCSDDGDEVAKVIGNLAIPESAEDRAALIVAASELMREVMRLRAENAEL